MTTRNRNAAPLALVAALALAACPADREALETPEGPVQLDRPEAIEQAPATPTPPAPLPPAGTPGGPGDTLIVVPDEAAVQPEGGP